MAEGQPMYEKIKGIIQENFQKKSKDQNIQFDRENYIPEKTDKCHSGYILVILLEFRSEKKKKKTTLSA